jgi:hypothetical protein
MSTFECTLCRYVDNICERLPTEESRQKCRELSQRVMRGEVDGKTARQELLRYVDEQTFSKAVQEVLSKLQAS